MLVIVVEFTIFTMEFVDGDGLAVFTIKFGTTVVVDGIVVVLMLVVIGAEEAFISTTADCAELADSGNVALSVTMTLAYTEFNW